MDESGRPRIAVVGPCGAGKSTLVKRLQAQGYNIRAVSQEHSYVPDMWQRISPTDVLIYLDAQLDTIAQRRQIQWQQSRLNALNHRLRHARAHTDFYLATDKLSAGEVAVQVRRFLDS